MSEEPFSVKKTLADYQNLFHLFLSFIKKISTNPQTPFFILIIAAAYYVLSFSLLSIFNQLLFNTGVHDVGVYDQPIWLLSRFQTPITTLGGNHILATHASFYCYLLAPLFWLWNNINMLYFVQSVAVGLAAFPLFFFARAKLQNSWLALSLALAFLLYPAIQNMNLENFHPEVITIFFFSWALFFLFRQDWPRFYLLACLSLLGKEDVSLTIAGVGLYLLIFKHDRRNGWPTLGLGLGWYLFVSRIVMPVASGLNIFSPDQPLIFSHWFGAFSQNIFNPAYYWINLTNPETMVYFWQLLAPLFFVPLLSPSILFIGLPALGINILSGVGYFRSINYHYNYIVAAVVFFAAAQGLSLLISGIKTQPGRLKTFAVPALGWLLLASALIANSRWSSFPFLHQWAIINSAFAKAQSAAYQEKHSALKLIPAEARISVSYSLFPQFSHRQKIYMFPNPFKEAFWFAPLPRPSARQAVDYLALELAQHDPEDKQIIHYLLDSNNYQKLYHEGTVMVLKNNFLDPRPNQGVNYKVVDRATQNIISQGTVTMLFFPDSDFELRNLMGDQIPLPPNSAVLFDGYLFIPDGGQYRLNLSTAGDFTMKVDQQEIRNNIITLTAGFHYYQIKYMPVAARYNLRLIITPPAGRTYIVPDHLLARSYKKAQFGQTLSDWRARQKAIAAFDKSQPNLLVNGGFERVFGEIPAGWKIISWQDPGAKCSFVVDATEKKSGRYSGKLEQVGQVDARWVQEVKVKPSTYYKLSGWIKTKDIRRSGGGAYLASEELGIRTEVIYGTSDWTYVEVIGKTTRHQTKINILCRLGDYGATNSGTAYFDQVELKEILPPADF